MSDAGRVRSQIADLKAVHREHLSRAQEQLANARRFRSMRDRPSNPTRAWEHQQDCDREAADAERDAESQRRAADRLMNEIRGLESYLR